MLKNDLLNTLRDSKKISIYLRIAFQWFWNWKTILKTKTLNKNK